MENIITYKNKKIKAPESWNDLTRSQFLFLCDKFRGLISTDSEITLDFVEDYYASRMLLTRKIIKMGWLDYRKVTASQHADLLVVTDFIQGELNLDKQHLPKIHVMGRIFYGPSKGLNQSSFGEFVAADSYFMNISKKQEISIMFKLIATLYRPKQQNIKGLKRAGLWNGDMRQDFNSNIVDARARFFEKYMSKKIAWAILYFYWGFRNTSVLRFENLFSEPEETEHVKISGNRYGWGGTLLEMSGKVFGDLEATEKTNWITVFVELSRQVDIQKLREMKK